MTFANFLKNWLQNTPYKMNPHSRKANIIAILPHIQNSPSSRILSIGFQKKM